MFYCSYIHTSTVRSEKKDTYHVDSKIEQNAHHVHSIDTKTIGSKNEIKYDHITSQRQLDISNEANNLFTRLFDEPVVSRFNTIIIIIVIIIITIMIII